MLKGHFRKLLLILPLLLVISIIVFFARYLTPQDPVEQSLGIYHQEEVDAFPYTKEAYEKVAITLGLHKSKFYFSVRPNYIPKDYDKIVFPSEKKIATKLLKAGVKWNQVSEFLKIENNSSNVNLLSKIADEILINGSTSIDYSSLDDLDKARIDALKIYQNSKYFYPSFQWHGTDNQYHNWLLEFFSNQKLKSNIDSSLVMPKIKKALAWTLSISLFAIFFSYLFGVLLGYKQIRSEHNIWKNIQTVLDVFFTMPLFWIATIAIVFFTTSDYGNWTNIFPSVHSMDFSGDSFLKQLFRNFHHLILPIICVVLHTTGYISGIMATNLKVQLNRPYILTAKQKGLSNDQIIRDHGLKNALFPILTLLTGSIPSAISGSLILEIIFNIPGIGKLLYNSILLADWNMVFPIVFIIAIVTAISYWLADILYQSFDPRIKLT